MKVESAQWGKGDSLGCCQVVFEFVVKESIRSLHFRNKKWDEILHNGGRSLVCNLWNLFSMDWTGQCSLCLET